MLAKDMKTPQYQKKMKTHCINVFIKGNKRNRCPL